MATLSHVDVAEVIANQARSFLAVALPPLANLAHGATSGVAFRHLGRRVGVHLGVEHQEC